MYTRMWAWGGEASSPRMEQSQQRLCTIRDTLMPMEDRGTLRQKVGGLVDQSAILHLTDGVLWAGWWQLLEGAGLLWCVWARKAKEGTKMERKKKGIFEKWSPRWEIWLPKLEGKIKQRKRNFKHRHRSKNLLTKWGAKWSFNPCIKWVPAVISANLPLPGSRTTNNWLWPPCVHYVQGETMGETWQLKHSRRAVRELFLRHGRKKWSLNS